MTGFGGKTGGLATTAGTTGLGGTTATDLTVEITGVGLTT